MSTMSSASSPSGRPWESWWRSDLSTEDWLAWSTWSVGAQVFWVQGWMAHRPPGTTNFLCAHRDGQPLWMHMMRVGAMEALEALMAMAPDPILLGINRRDKYRRGWAHLMILDAVPDHLAAAGLALLDETWVHPDALSMEPPALLPRPALAMNMARRFWMDSMRRSDGRVRAREFFHRWARAAEKGHRPDLVRIWLFWADGGASSFFA